MGASSPDAQAALAPLAPAEIRLVAGLLDRYERSEPASLEQAAAFAEMRRAFPSIDMPTRLEPRSPIIGRLVQDARLDEDAFEDAVHWVATDSSLSIDQLATLLSLLADARVPFGIHTVFDIVDRMVDIPLGVLVDDIQAALVILAGRRPRAVISLMERLQDLRLLRPPGVFGALQSVASDAPDHLGAAMQIASHAIRSDMIDIDGLAYLLRDLCRRAGAYTVVLALAEQDPDTASKLLSAAFVMEDSPLTLRQRSFDDAEDQRLEIAYGGEPVPISHARLGRPVQPWLSSVRSAHRIEAALEALRREAIGKETFEQAAITFSAERAGKRRPTLIVQSKIYRRVEISDQDQVPEGARPLLDVLGAFMGSRAV